MTTSTHEQIKLLLEENSCHECEGYAQEFCLRTY